MRAAALSLACAATLLAQDAEVAALLSPAPAIFAGVAKSGNLAAAVCEDGKLRLWTLPKGKVTRTLDLAGRNIYSFALSGDGRWVAAGDFAGLLTVWNTATGAPRMRLEMSAYAIALTFSADGNRLAVAPARGPVGIYEVSSGSKLAQLPSTLGGTQAMAFSRDGAHIATSDSDTAVRVYNSRNGELLARHTDFVLEPLAAAFTADGKQLLAGGADKVIAVLDAGSGAPVRKSARLDDPVAFLDVSPDGALTAAGLMHADNLLMPGHLLISETATGKQVRDWLPPERMLGGTWTEEGHLLAVFNAQKGLRVWRVY